jgi:iron(II)-dependent oxidoreductase
MLSVLLAACNAGAEPVEDGTGGASESTSGGATSNGETGTSAASETGDATITGTEATATGAATESSDGADESTGAGDCPGTPGMVCVPGGPFTMGSRMAANEQPVREVTLDSFEIDLTETTVASYRACVDAGVCTEADTDVDCHWGQPDVDDHPINCVRWQQADDYCQWAGKRLPTEAEWEKAARGEDARTYPWGELAPTCELVVMPGCGTMTLPVGSKPDGSSPYAVADASGNVWEWVADFYQEDYYARAPDLNPPGPADGFDHVIRGGAYDASDLTWLRCSARFAVIPSYTRPSLGFRCAKG